MGNCEKVVKKTWLNARYEEERKDLPTPHNNPIIRLINDVMKANSVENCL